MVSVVGRPALLALALVGGVGACAEPPGEVQGPVLYQETQADEGGSFTAVDSDGDGCGPETARLSISPDGQAFTAIFSAFVASAGPEQEPEAERNCVIQAHVSAPAGWSYRLDNVIYRGLASAEQGARGSRSATYVVPGSRVFSPRPSRWTGPVEQNFNTDDIKDDSPIRWSACGGESDVLISSKIEAQSNGTAAGFVAVDSIDGALIWKRCE